MRYYDQSFRVSHRPASLARFVSGWLDSPADETDFLRKWGRRFELWCDGRLGSAGYECGFGGVFSKWGFCSVDD